ncbi:MAG: YidC/Oxa1 family insertase periplasmic-domain containing protein [Planctomycetota bacterium]|nr:YidC/Oxa1 family insertase periplasmic-domain containing protein [Planctomycetota bacterium]
MESEGYIIKEYNKESSLVPAMIKETDAPKDSEKSFSEIEIKNYCVWAGIENRYFMNLAYGDSATGFFPVYSLSVKQKVKSKGVDKYFALPYLAINTEKSDTEFKMFVGPKDQDVLDVEEGGRLKNVISYGMFSFVSKPAYWVLKQINRVTNNWGLAIIALTILISILMLPLIIKQRNAMQSMQKLQPQIKQLQAKYKVERGDDIKTRQSKKQSLNEEMMLLYKKENVNPMGGCLPLLLQLPILMALLDMIRISIDLRKAPLFLWWQDLSTADPTFVLPILMGVIMFLSQKITPVAPDQQSGAMKFLPFIFLLMFASAPSGLVLYWTTSSAFNLGTQVLMTQFASGNKSESKNSPVAADKNAARKNRGKK